LAQPFLDTSPSSTRSLGVSGAIVIFFSYLLAKNITYYIVLAIAGLIIGFTNSGSASDEVNGFNNLIFMFGTLVSLIMAGIVIFFLVVFFEGKRDWGDLNAGIGFSVGGVPSILTGILLGGLFGLGLLTILQSMFPPDTGLPMGNFGNMLNSSGLVFLAWVFILTVCFPFLEEFLFRGVLYAGIARSWNSLLAGIIVTTLFMLLHLQRVTLYPPATLAIFILAISTLSLRILTKSIGPAISFHSTYNLSIISAISYQKWGIETG